MRGSDLRQNAVRAGMLLAVALALIIVVAPRPVESGDFAAWVGALGSICTIAAAIWIAIIELEQREAESRKADRERALRVGRALVIGLTSLTGTIRTIFDSSHEGLAKPVVVQMMAADLEEVSERLRAVPIADLPNPEAVQALVHAMGTTRSTLVLLRDLAASPKGTAVRLPTPVLQKALEHAEMAAALGKSALGGASENP